MTRWALIIIVVKLGGSYGDSPAVAVATVPDFTSEQACEVAVAAATSKLPLIKAFCIPTGH